MFERFHVTPDDLLGKGGESEVYALDTTRVLRVYRAGARVDYAERRRAFYALLQEQRPVLLPHTGAGLIVEAPVDRRVPERRKRYVDMR